MKRLLYLLAVILLVACNNEYKTFQTKPLPLRQLIKQSDTSEYAKGKYFLIWASYEKGEIKETKIRMYAGIDSVYRYVECGIEEVGIKIDNNVTIPYLLVTGNVYLHKDDTMTDYQIVFYNINKTYTLVCPEKYLPEKLLPIEL